MREKQWTKRVESPSVRIAYNWTQKQMLKFGFK